MITLLAVASVFSFNGGNDAALAAAVQREFQHPVVILVDPDSRWAPTRIAYKSEINLPNYLASKLGLVASDSKSFGFAKSFWPEGLFRKQNGHLYTNRIPIADPVIRESNGNISITPDDGGGIRLSTLRTVNGLASMRWHWFYDTAMITVSCEQTAPDQLIKAINGALGARLERDKAGYFLNLDPKSLRQRATSMLEMPPKTEGSTAQRQEADRAYYRELLKVATDDQIRKAYSKYGQNVEFRIRKGSKLHDLAVDRLYVASVAEGASPSIREMLDKVDLDGPILANLSSDGHIAAIYTGKVPNTQFVY